MNNHREGQCPVPQMLKILTADLTPILSLFEIKSLVHTKERGTGFVLEGKQ